VVGDDARRSPTRKTPPVIEVIDHPGELELRLSHATCAGVYAEAVRGLVAESQGSVPAGGAERRILSLASSTPETLLADLLNEVVYVMETEGFVPRTLEVGELEGGRLRGTLVGRSSADVRPLVKAATYHDLRVWQEDGAWHGRVVLDV